MINYSVILPVFNEISVLPNCLESLRKQTVFDQMEAIVVDDGSTDGSDKYATLKQNHQGPGAARNLGASKAKGRILIFVDADMEFEPDFVEKLTLPIREPVASQGAKIKNEHLRLREGILKTIGTFSKEEYLLNKENIWARLWNENLGRKPTKMEPRDFDTDRGFLWNFGKKMFLQFEKSKTNASYEPNKAHVFRAILRDEFLRVGGFDPTRGYTDDWSLSEKLEVLAVAAPGAKYYHRNPETLKEVWQQARWFGKNEFLTGNFIRKIYNLIRYCPLWAVAKIFNFQFLIFKLIYNSAVFTSVLLSFFGENKAK